MPAYLLVRANVTDMEQYQQYMKLTPAIVEKYGGTFIIRGGDKVILEGTRCARTHRPAQVRQHRSGRAHV